MKHLKAWIPIIMILTSDIAVAGRLKLEVQLNFSPPPIAFSLFCLNNFDACAPKPGRKLVDMYGAAQSNFLSYFFLSLRQQQVAFSIKPQSDGIGKDTWSLGPNVKAGDCEDYVLAKRDLLIKDGWPTSSLLIATGVTVWGEGHAILVVRTTTGDWVLDNLQPFPVSVDHYQFNWQMIQSPYNPMRFIQLKNLQIKE